jgi:hypothetical protein
LLLIIIHHLGVHRKAKYKEGWCKAYPDPAECCFSEPVDNNTQCEYKSQQKYQERDYGWAIPDIIEKKCNQANDK